MPARGEPSYYRWAEDKPCTMNQTYGYELRSGDSRNAGSNTTCKQCVAEAAATAAAVAKRQAERQQRKAAESRRDGNSSHYSSEVQCKPINRGYTMGHVQITKRLQQASSGRKRDADDT